MPNVKRKEVLILQENLEVIRQILDWSIEDMGNVLGVSRQTIYNLEKKKTPMSLTQYIAILSVLTSNASELNETLHSLESGVTTDEKNRLLLTKCKLNLLIVILYQMNHPDAYGEETVFKLRSLAGALNDTTSASLMERLILEYFPECFSETVNDSEDAKDSENPALTTLAMAGIGTSVFFGGAVAGISAVASSLACKLISKAVKKPDNK